MDSSELICPACHLPLVRGRGTMRCEAGHSFDVAREGYVNLLVGKRRAGATAGDSADMVRARRAFLQRGYYGALAAEVARGVGEARVIADVGCGEGYYLGRLMAEPVLAGARFYGTDVSKAAVVAAAKAHSGAMFVVADTNDLIPLADGSVDVLLDIFAPRNASEFARVVRPGGRAVVVIPGAGHLAELRERFRLLAIEGDKAVKISGQLEGFELESAYKVEESIQLDGVSLRELLEMTPNARHMDDATREQLDEVDEIATRIEFEVLVFMRV